VLAAACSSSDRPAEATKGSVQIIFGEISAAPSHTPLYVAISEGFFTKAGLNVTIQTLTGGTPSAMAAMATDSVNMMMAGAPEFIEYSAKKVIHGKIIAQLQDSTFDIVAATGITNLEQLKGKIVGISGLNGGDQIYIEAVLRHHGMSPSDVSFLTSGNAANRLTALSSNAVQAIAVSNSTRETSAKIGTVLLKSSDSVVKIPSSTIFASDDLITNHKATLQAFIGALVEATKWTKANHEAAAVYCAQSSGASQEACLSAFNTLSDPAKAGRYTWSSTYAIDTTAMAEALSIEVGHTAEAGGLKLEDVIDTAITGTTL
jgi:ABC-type nitrate/sulfonate/bicarbonate transport system substrate-binding protein